MEQQTAHDAADTITQLLRAYVGEKAIDVDVNEALDTRDALREIGDATDYDLPEVGEVMYDENGSPVDIEEVTHYTAELYHIEGDSQTVAEYRTNDDYDPQSPVVKVTYPHGDKVYAMPLARLSYDK
jgi:hypothetical protein